MVVYLDLIFFLNLLIDAATLHTTAWSRKLQAKLWRIWAAAAIGASYVLLMFAPSMSIMFTFTAKVIFSVIMIITAFGYHSLQHFLRNIGAFYVINFIAAGAIMGVHYVLQTRSEVWNGMLISRSGGIAFELQLGMVAVLLSFLFAVILYRIVMKSLVQKRQAQQFHAKVEVWIADYYIECMGLVDTGNRLYEPLTRTPVMIMEAGLWEAILPAKWIAQLNQANTDDLLRMVEDEAFPWPERLRFVPYKGIQHASSFMLAIKPDRVIVTLNGIKTETAKVYAGFKGGALSNDATFQAIVHPDLAQLDASASQPFQVTSQSSHSNA